MNEIEKYEPMMCLTTFSEETFYFKKSKLEEFKKVMNNSKFVTIWENIVNTSSINTIKPATSNTSKVECHLMNIDIDLASKVRFEVRRWRLSHDKELTPWTVQNIIAKIKGDII